MRILACRDTKLHEISSIGRIKILSSGLRSTLPLNHRKIGPYFPNISFKVEKQDMSMTEEQ